MDLFYFQVCQYKLLVNARLLRVVDGGHVVHIPRDDFDDMLDVCPQVLFQLSYPSYPLCEKNRISTSQFFFFSLA